jgi:hypothetical protein
MLIVPQRGTFQHAQIGSKILALLRKNFLAKVV